MQFARYPSRQPRPITPGRIAAARRAVRRDLDSVPLFPDLARDASPDARLARQTRGEAAEIARRRRWEADVWRGCRHVLRRLRPTLRAGLLRYWQAPDTSLPRSASYLAGIITEARADRWNPWAALAERRRLALRLPMPPADTGRPRPPRYAPNRRERRAGLTLRPAQPLRPSGALP